MKLSIARQSVFRQAVRTLALLTLLGAIVAALAYLLVPGKTREGLPRQTTARSEPAENRPAFNPPPPGGEPYSRAVDSFSAPTMRSHREDPLIAVATLEHRFRTAQTDEARNDAAQQIAGHNDAEAVRAIGRLFANETNPRFRLTLLAALGDIDDGEALEARLAMLAMAVRGKGREERTTALDLLERLEDPRALALIETTMRSDPDAQVRQAASAIYQAVQAAPR